MRLWVAAIVLACSIGCGDDDDADDGDDDGAADGSPDLADASGPADAGALTCGELGAGAVSGTAAGAMLDPIESARYSEVPLFGYAYPLVLDEQSGACGAVPTGSGEHLGFFFCEPAAAGVYELVDIDAFPEKPCPGAGIAAGLLEEENGSDLAFVVSGSITITAVGECVTGSFAATFEGGGALDGSFAAVSCEVP